MSIQYVHLNSKRIKFIIIDNVMYINENCLTPFKFFPKFNDLPDLVRR